MRWNERRQSYRVTTPRAEAICEADGLGDRYQLVNLSLGGVRLSGGRCLLAGATVHLTVYTGHYGCLALSGEVVRSGPNDLAVCFAELDPKLEQALDDLLTDMIIEDFSARPKQPVWDSN
jgi:hypothetical protein